MIARAPGASFEDRLEEYRQRANNRLESALSDDSQMPARLLEAMRYSVLGGGKRVRPLLAYASGELFDLPSARIDVVARPHTVHSMRQQRYSPVTHCRRSHSKRCVATR
jgi:geranylgeranyl pyrophosphate synthase